MEVGAALVDSLSLDECLRVETDWDPLGLLTEKCGVLN